MELYLLPILALTLALPSRPAVAEYGVVDCYLHDECGYGDPAPPRPRSHRHPAPRKHRSAPRTRR